MFHGNKLEVEKADCEPDTAPPLLVSASDKGGSRHEITGE